MGMMLVPRERSVYPVLDTMDSATGEERQWTDKRQRSWTPI